MTRNNYVDLDLYGRGFDGIFGYGAEQENKRQVLMKFKAMQRFKERVKPGEYIDLDLYGRGDPRVFGQDAHIHTQKNAQSLMEDVQRRKREGHVNHAILMFPVGLRAITRKARQLVKRTNSSSSETSEEEPIASGNAKSDLEGATLDWASPPIHEAKDENESPLEDSDVTSNAPRRFKSKLPSEEVPPFVEPGVVARAVKSIGSQDRIEDSGIVEWSRNDVRADSAHTEAHSPNLTQGIVLPGGPGSSRIVGSPADREAEIASANDQTRRLAEPVSTNSEAEVARDILVGSDEEFPLSFSTNARDGARIDYNSTSSEEDLLARQPIQERVLVDTAGRVGSTGNKITGLFRSQDSDSGSDQGGTSEESRGEAGPSQIADTYSSTEGEDEDVSSDEAGEVIEVSPNESQSVTAPVEADSMGDAQQGAKLEDVQPVLGTREASIVQVVETGNLSIDNDLMNDGDIHTQEVMEKRTSLSTTAESASVTEAAAEASAHGIDEETANLTERATDGSSSDGSESSGEGDSDDQDRATVDGSENMNGSDFMTDSDRSDEAASSSVVMSSSPEEDSDDIEIETSEEVEEESEEAEEIEEGKPEEQEEKSDYHSAEVTGDYSDVRVVNSSDAGMTSDEDNESVEGLEGNNSESEDGRDAENGSPQDGGEEAKTFWQRLSFFGTIVQGSWTVY